MAEQPSDAVEIGLGNAEHLADVAHRRARSISDDVRDHRRVPTAVLRVDVLDHLLAPIVLDVEIDVRWLCALAAQEALEEKLHPHWIDGGDAKAVADRAVRSASSSL